MTSVYEIQFTGEINMSQERERPHSHNSFLYFRISENCAELWYNQCSLELTLNVSLKFWMPYKSFIVNMKTQAQSKTLQRFLERWFKASCSGFAEFQKKLLEAVARRCSVKQVFLEIFQKFTGKHLCQSLFFNKVADLMPTSLLKRRLWHRCFPVNFAKFLRTPFLTEHFCWLLLIYYSTREWIG